MGFKITDVKDTLCIFISVNPGVKYLGGHRISIAGNSYVISIKSLKEKVAENEKTSMNYKSITME